MATLLSADLLADALTRLPGWSGDTSALRRTVELPPERLDELLRRVQQTADAMNHHPDVERTENAATFSLSTHSAGGVTELDVALASRIDDLVTQVAAATG